MARGKLFVGLALAVTLGACSSSPSPHTGSPLPAGPEAGLPSSSPGCGKTPAHAGAYGVSLQIGNRPRTYLAYVPPGYDPARPVSLVFSFHGYGVDGTADRAYHGLFLEAAAGDDAISIYPDADPYFKQSWFGSGDDTDLRFFDTLLEDFEANYCIDPRRILVTGFSDGGFMTNVLRCKRPDVLRAVAPVAGIELADAGRLLGDGGLNIGDFSCDKPVASFVTHAQNDSLVAFQDGVNTRNAVVAANGCASTTTEFMVPGCLASNNCVCVAYDGCRPGYPVNWCTHFQDHAYDQWMARGIWTFFAALEPLP